MRISARYRIRLLALAACGMLAVQPLPAGDEAKDGEGQQGITSPPTSASQPVATGREPSPEASADGTLSGEVTPGVRYFVDSEDRNSAKFLEFRDVPNGFVLPHLEFTWSPKERTYFHLDAIDVSEDDQRIEAEFGQIDRWKGAIRWVENPRRWTDHARQLYGRQANGVFTLDDTLQAAVQAAPASVDTTPADGLWDAGTKGALIKSAIQQSARDVDVMYQRERGGVGFEYTPTSHWMFSLDADRDRREGTMPQTLGMNFSFAPAEVAAPYDLETDWATGRAEYAGRNFNVGVQLTASDFETGYKTLTWDNQLFLNDVAINANSANPGQMRMLLGTDNESLRIGVNGGVNLPGHTRIDALAARTETTQDDPFQPMTINSLLTAAPLPSKNYDGEHNTTILDFRITSRPVDRLKLGAWYRSADLENDSPSLVFDDYVSTDYQFPLCSNANECGATTNRIARRSLPYGFKRANMGGLVGVTPVKWFTGTVSFDSERVDRDFSGVEESTEDIWKVMLDFDVSETLSVRATAKFQEREADHYDAHYFEQSFPIGEAVVAPVNEGMRRYNWTDRDRDAYSVMFDWTPLEKWSFYGEAIYSDNDYSDPETGKDIGDSFNIQEDRDFNGIPETYNILLAGRTDDESTSYSLGVAWTQSSRFHMFADFTWEEWEYGMETRYRNVTAGVGTDDPLDNWGNDTEDDYQTATLGFDLGLTKDSEWRLEGDGSWSRGTGHIDTHFVPGGQSSGNTTLTEFPDLETTLTIVTIAVRHQISANLDYSIGYWFERWSEDNFASDFNKPYMGDPGNDPGSDRSIFLGMDYEDYENHIASFMLHYTF